MYTINCEKLIETKMFGRMRQASGWEHTGRRLKENLAVLVIGGGAVFCYGDSEYKMNPGELLIVPKNTPYTAVTDSFCEYYFFHFNTEIEVSEIKKHTSDIRHEYSFVLPKTVFTFNICEKTSLENSFNEILNKVSAFSELTSNITPEKKLLMDIKLTEILITCAACESDSGSNKMPTLLEKLIGYIQLNYGNKLTLAAAAEKFCVSKSYIARLFKRYLNTTFTAYLNDIRLHHSAELLKSSNMNISEIARFVGIDDCFYFSKLFKKKFLVCPSEYKISER